MDESRDEIGEKGQDRVGKKSGWMSRGKRWVSEELVYTMCRSFDLCN